MEKAPLKKETATRDNFCNLLMLGVLREQKLERLQRSAAFGGTF